VRVSCARSPPRAFDAGGERQSARPGFRRQRQATSSHVELSCRTPEAAGGPRGTVASSSARHGRLRRNAVSPHGVRLSGAPGAPLRIGCSSANRALAGKLLWDGIVAVPKVFDAGCPALFRYEGCGLPSESARSWDAGERCSRPDAYPTYPPGLRTHGDARRNAKRCGNRRYLAANTSSADQLWPRGAAISGRRATRAHPGGRE
jgi:hypothetical protein